ncbi:hypothetical protein RF11_05043 [Thelohanellus kitauei]|uniref:Retrotransposon gag domain-containing protein n=1 Tax=Thelohanellus kitauei TaxID=669202 RepID=A0A0C2JZ95_THEKT|nr:hypothetical protein RF11_05043 [Thelohanellus kitauei]
MNWPIYAIDLIEVTDEIRGGHLKDKFTEKSETWNSYKNRLIRALKITILKTSGSETKVLCFLQHVGSEVNNILTTHFHPQDMEDIPFDYIIAYSENHFESKPPLLVRRMQSQNRKRDDSESVENYIMALKTLAAHYEFGGNNEERIRDQFII